MSLLSECSDTEVAVLMMAVQDLTSTLGNRREYHYSDPLRKACAHLLWQLRAQLIRRRLGAYSGRVT